MKQETVIYSGTVEFPGLDIVVAIDNYSIYKKYPYLKNMPIFPCDEVSDFLNGMINGYSDKDVSNPELDGSVKKLGK